MSTKQKNMPKRGGFRTVSYNGSGGSRFSALKDYTYTNDHDDRSNNYEGRKEQRHTRRVSFKPSQLQNKGGIKMRNAELALRTRLEDDEEMDGYTGAREGQTTHRRKGSPIPKGKFGRFNNLTDKLMPTDFGWYLVTIHSGQRYSKDEILRALINALNQEGFVPHYWRTERSSCQFYVDNFELAKRFAGLARQIQMPDGFRLVVRVRGSVPLVPVDDAFKEKMKLAMAKRYNPHTHALDMSKFYADAEFKNMFCSVHRVPVMSAAIDIMEKNIPDLEALNLNDNGITSMESFKNVARRLPNLKILYLGQNKIPSLAHLLVLREVAIIELVLKNNPLRDRYKEHALYVSEVRRKFPKLRKLDGEDLQPMVLFDLTEEHLSLPKAKASFLCDLAGTELVRQFLEQYFKIFDSDNRQPLLEAYHENAMFSLSVPPASHAGRLNNFWKFNRNMRRIMTNEEHVKMRLLKVGRLAVVSTLAELPKTKHDHTTFTVDLTLFTEKMIMITVTGLFKELDDGTSNNNNNNSTDVRYFHRQLIIVPANGGYCIRNELLFVTSALSAQTRLFNKLESAAAQPIALPDVGANSLADRLQQQQLNDASVPVMPAAMMQPSGSVALPTATITSPAPDDATKMQMVQAMSMQSGMNLEWSTKCLEETNWDYNHAAFVFDKLHKENKIPAVAFNK